MEDVLSAIFEFLKGALSFSFEFFSELFTTCFGTLFNFLFDTVFVNTKEFIVSGGNKVLLLFFNMFSGSVPSLGFLVYFFGLLILVFVIKQIISILR